MDNEGSKFETHIHGNIYGSVHAGQGDITSIHSQGQLPDLSEQAQRDIVSQYAAWQKERYEYLPISGIPIRPNIHIPLDHIYIKLRSLPQRWQIQNIASMSNKITLEETLASVRRLGELQWQRTQEADPRNTLACHPGEEPVSPEQAILQHHKIAIIGIPGSGKSTLLRHLVWEHSNNPQEPYPLLIPLGQADLLMSQHRLSLLDAALEILTAHKVGIAKTHLHNTLVASIEHKKVRFLFDGLDEIHLCKEKILATLNALAADDNRMVVTSRPVGYERLEGFEHYEVLPLLPEDAFSFSMRWFQSLAESRDMPQEERLTWAVERGDWLKEQIHTRPGLREIARVPLLLTFLAILSGDEPRSEIPRFRKNLYKEYVERLYTSWEERRNEFSLGDMVGEEAKDLALWLLYRFAYILHSAYYGSIRQEEPTLRFVKTLLSQELAARWQLNEIESTALCTRTLEFWEQAGLLIRYRIEGEEVLAFRHLTFQEYGASRALAKIEPPLLWSILQEHLFVPQWGELIPLTLAQLTPEASTWFFKRLLEADQRDSNWHRPLLLAASALADGATADNQIRLLIIDELVKLIRTIPLWSLEEISATTIFNILAKLEGDDYCASALRKIAINEYTDLFQRILAAEAIGRLGLTTDAITILRSISQDHLHDLPLQLWIARVLGRLEYKQEAMEILNPPTEPFYFIPNNGMMAGVVSEILAELGYPDQAAEILSQLATNPDEGLRVRVEAIRSLRRIGQTEIASSLATTLASNSLDKLTAIERGDILAQLGFYQESRHILLEIIQAKTERAREKIEAIRFLYRREPSLEYMPVLQSILFNKMNSSEDRLFALQTFNLFGPAPQVISFLATLLKEQKLNRALREHAKKIHTRLTSNEAVETEERPPVMLTIISPQSEHFIELKWRLLKILLSVLVITTLTSVFYQPFVIPLLSQLYGHAINRFLAGPPLLARFIITIDLVFFLTSPVAIYQTWAYIIPGLYYSERKILNIDVGIFAFLLYIFCPASIFLLTHPGAVNPFFFNQIVPINNFVVVTMLFILILAVFRQNIRHVYASTLSLISLLLVIPLLYLPIYIICSTIFLLLASYFVLIVFLLSGIRDINSGFFRDFKTRLIIYTLMLDSARESFSLLRQLSKSYLSHVFGIMSPEQALGYIRKQADIPAELSWLLADAAESSGPTYSKSAGNFLEDLDEDDPWPNNASGSEESSGLILSTSLALNLALSTALNTKTDPSLRILAARSIGDLGLRKEMASIISQVCFDSKTKMNLKEECIATLYRWREKARVTRLLKDFALDEQTPTGIRFWAIQILLKAGPRQAAPILEEIAANTAIHPRVRKFARHIKNQALRPAIENLAQARQHNFTLILALQTAIFVASCLLFAPLINPALSHLYALHPGKTFINSLTLTLQISLSVSLFFSLPLYMFYLFQTIKDAKNLIWINVNWKFFICLIFLYPVSLVIILLFRHSSVLSALFSLLPGNNIWNVNRIAILPFLIFVATSTYNRLAAPQIIFICLEAAVALIFLPLWAISLETTYLFILVFVIVNRLMPSRNFNLRETQ